MINYLDAIKEKKEELLQLKNEEEEAETNYHNVWLDYKTAKIRDVTLGANILENRKRLGTVQTFKAKLIRERKAAAKAAALGFLVLGLLDFAAPGFSLVVSVGTILLPLIGSTRYYFLKTRKTRNYLKVHSLEEYEQEDKDLLKEKKKNLENLNSTEVKLMELNEVKFVCKKNTKVKETEIEYLFNEKNSLTKKLGQVKRKPILNQKGNQLTKKK